MTTFFINKLYSKSAIKKTKEKILLLGSGNKVNINVYLNIKLFILLVGFIVILIFEKYGYITSFIYLILTYFIYDYLLLDLPIKKRAKSLEHDAIFFFEVLSLTLESEKNIKLCIEATSSSISSDLSNEFKAALKECKLGKSFTESLNNLMKRIPSKTINNVILNIIESVEYGNPIEDTLKNQVNYITDMRILSIKERINKMPTKISIISVLFFVPLMMLLILGPILINYLLK